MRISDWSSDVCSSDLGGEAERVLLDYGQAIKDLARSNLFPGDLLLKNFGVSRSGRVVFYDYDELCLVTDRKSVVEGKSVSVRVDLGGGRILKKQNYSTHYRYERAEKLIAGKHGEYNTSTEH